MPAAERRRPNDHARRQSSLLYDLPAFNQLISIKRMTKITVSRFDLDRPARSAGDVFEGHPVAGYVRHHLVDQVLVDQDVLELAEEGFDGPGSGSGWWTLGFGLTSGLG
jgi:hypothetical protein